MTEKINTEPTPRADRHASRPEARRRSNPAGVDVAAANAAAEPSGSSALAAEKLAVAREALEELDLDCWLVFVRETGDGGDPVLPLIFGHDLTWQSAIIVPRTAERLPGPVAIVGTHDAALVESTGLFAETVGYIEGIRSDLRAVLDRLAPRSIAIDHSIDDVKADGLTHGMFLLLRRHLEGTPHADLLVSAEELVRIVRGRKSATELRRIEGAIATTQQMLDEVGRWARPGRSERETWSFMQEQMRRLGVGPAWSSAGCPIVTTSPRSMGGHGIADASLTIERGCIFHVDVGVRQEGYCSDLQRSWYVPHDGESEIPEDVRSAFDAVRAAVDAGFAALRAGVEAWCVDAAARSTLVAAGWPEYDHATGHEVGRAAHDGGVVLGPRWERYGRTPHRRVEVGHVVTLELGVDVPGRGYLGIEEMAVVEAAGPRWLSRPQRAIWTLSARPEASESDVAAPSEAP
ncbi:MAG TPA: M24 family metallopeptidase [Phycisphaerales bacterium]|nr:M24 family metallopeptidase [Phycisphaerales bacterium]HMP38705.1 M24 family metallopeptidase [Phycisphaerales bacterium]